MRRPQAARDDIFAQSAELERQAILAIPDGEYTAEGALDNDGISTDPVPVKLTVRVSGRSTGEVKARRPIY